MTPGKLKPLPRTPPTGLLNKSHLFIVDFDAWVCCLESLLAEPDVPATHPDPREPGSEMSLHERCRAALDEINREPIPAHYEERTRIHMGRVCKPFPEWVESQAGGWRHEHNWALEALRAK